MIVRIHRQLHPCLKLIVILCAALFPDRHQKILFCFLLLRRVFLILLQGTVQIHHAGIDHIPGRIQCRFVRIQIGQGRIGCWLIFSAVLYLYIRDRDLIFAVLHLIPQKRGCRFHRKALLVCFGNPLHLPGRGRGRGQNDRCSDSAQYKKQDRGHQACACFTAKHCINTWTALLLPTRLSACPLHALFSKCCLCSGFQIRALQI